MNLKHSNLERIKRNIQNGIFSKVRKPNSSMIWNTIFDKFCFYVMENLRDSIDRGVNQNPYLRVNDYVREHTNESN